MIWAPVAGMLKRSLGWIGKTIAKWIAWQLALWLAGAGLAWMIITLQEDIALALRRHNEGLMAKVFGIEDHLFNLVHRVQVWVDGVLSGIEARVVAVLDALLPEQIEAILCLVNFAAWVDALARELADAAANAVRDTVRAATEPISAMARGIADRLSGARLALEAVFGALAEIERTLNERIDALFAGVEMAVEGINARIADVRAVVEGATAALDAKIDLLFAAVGAAFSAANAVIDDAGAVADGAAAAVDAKVDGLFQTVEGTVNVFNAAVYEIRDLVLAGEAVDWDSYLFSMASIGLDREEYRIDLGIDWTAYHLDPASLGLDREEYRIEIPVDWDSILLSMAALGLDREEWRISVPVPEALETARNEIEGAERELSELAAWIDDLPARTREAFLEHYPAFLRANLEARIRSFLIIAITQALVQRTNAVRAAFEDARGNLEAYFVEQKEGIIAKTREIGEAIYEAEMAFVEKLPAILRPGLAKQIDRIKEKVIESQDEILANIDDLYIDTAAVDSILQRVKNYESGDAPMLFDSEPWTLNDIYRMLCNYYWKHERMALAMIIASVDMGIDTEELRGLLLSMGAPDIGEDDHYAA